MSGCSDRAPALPKNAIVGGLLILLGAAACDVPNFEGPQLQDPPEGYLLRPDPSQAHAMFAYLPAVYHDAWVQSLPPYSTIKINGFAGTLTLEDVLAAQDSLRARGGDPELSFGTVEPLSIDGREAWGWEERIETATRGIPWVGYRVMVPYDTISYSIEVSTEDPLLKADAPESIKAIVSTFAVGETVWNLPLLALGMGLLLFAVHMAREKSKAKAARLQSINLVKIKKKVTPEEEGEAAPEPVLASASSSGPASPE
jgi:hypothetical protein